MSNRYKNIEVFRESRLNVVQSRNGASDCIALNCALFCELRDHFNRFSYSHTSNFLSGLRTRVTTPASAAVAANPRENAVVDRDEILVERRQASGQALLMGITHRG